MLSLLSAPLVIWKSNEGDQNNSAIEFFIYKNIRNENRNMKKRIVFFFVAGESINNIVSLIITQWMF